MVGEGFHCDEAPNGVEALEKLAVGDYVLVLSDLRMPRMDGLELLRNIQEKHPAVAVILITAVAEVEVALNALSMGAMDYLTKPFHIEEVRARVAQALEKRRLVLENRHYQQELEARVAVQAGRIEELFLGGVQAVVHALEVKDPYTRGHSIRVSRFSMLMARHLGLDDDTIRQIELGGHVHDIGKIGVRESILNKEGPLTDAEYAHIMTHPVVGWQILSPLLTDAPLALNIVRSHHERFDGNGVPDALRGDKAYSSRAIRATLRGRGIAAVSPEPKDQIGHRKKRGSRGGRPVNFDAEDYKNRNVVERGFNSLKNWRGLATRYDKYAITYRGGVVLASIVLWLQA